MAGSASYLATFASGSAPAPHCSVAVPADWSKAEEQRRAFEFVARRLVEQVHQAVSDPHHGHPHRPHPREHHPRVHHANAQRDTGTNGNRSTFQRALDAAGWEVVRASDAHCLLVIAAACHKHIHNAEGR